MRNGYFEVGKQYCFSNFFSVRLAPASECIKFIEKKHQIELFFKPTGVPNEIMFYLSSHLSNYIKNISSNEKKILDFLNKKNGKCYLNIYDLDLILKKTNYLSINFWNLIDTEFDFIKRVINSGEYVEFMDLQQKKSKSTYVDLEFDLFVGETPCVIPDQLDPYEELTNLSSLEKLVRLNESNYLPYKYVVNSKYLLRNKKSMFFENYEHNDPFQGSSVIKYLPPILADSATKIYNYISSLFNSMISSSFFNPYEIVRILAIAEKDSNNENALYKSIQSVSVDDVWRDSNKNFIAVVLIEKENIIITIPIWTII